MASRQWATIDRANQVFTNEMEPFSWYSIAILGFLVLLLVRRSYRRLNAAAVWVSRRLQHRVFLHRNSWSPFTISVLDAVIVFAFVGVNALLAFISRKETLPRLAIVNMVPLFLGGRTNVQIDFLGISLSTYQLAHHWVGRVVVFQSILHCIFSFQSLVLSPSKIVGAIAGVLLIFNILLSLLPVRRWIGATAFGLSHLVLSLAILVTAGIHAALLTSSFWSFSSILCMVAGGLLTISAFLRVARKVYRGKPHIIKHNMVADTATIWLRLGHSVQTRPGTYFYLRFPSLPLRLRFQSILLPVVFWQAETRGSSKEIAFIVPEPLSRAMKNSKANVSIDGPYGGGLRPGLYELVILLAEGLGIAGVLPLALSVLSRRMQDENDKASKTAHPKLYCDKTRKVDLVWVLQDNSQVQQALELLESLKSMAVSKVNINLLTRYLMLTMSWTFLMVWIFYPEPGFQPQFKDPKKEKKVQKNENSEEKTWFEHHVTPDECPEFLKALISKESKRTPGKGMVYACGSGPFCRLARTAVRSIHSSTSFTEVDYHPSDPCSGLGSKMNKTSTDGSEVVAEHSRSRKTMPVLPQHVVCKQQGRWSKSHRGGQRHERVVLDEKKPTGHSRNPRPAKAQFNTFRAQATDSERGLSATLND